MSQNLHFNIGALTTIAILILQHYGVGSDQASTIVSNIMLGASSLYTLFGLIHNIYTKGTVSQTNGQNVVTVVPKVHEQVIDEIKNAAAILNTLIEARTTLAQAMNSVAAIVPTPIVSSAYVQDVSTIAKDTKTETVA
jgi:hypothetical protein